MTVIAIVLASAWLLFAALTLAFGHWWVPTVYSASDYALKIERVFLDGKDITVDCACVYLWSSNGYWGFGYADLFHKNGNGWMISESGTINTHKHYGMIRLTWRPGAQ